ncbi:nuclear transport factor 2 family protein [Amycolatopsis sp. NBRC 101858]|uniref:nuclear transport factor 2 family protein n=1 Tax=Amycolatopsis sp. NBRC 101858 TaxID=3032200 RepID=UPI002554E070|nr:nuclear transport factor 2 family protein [Amycolatopsis sp. NBRC 101858]
MKRVLAVLAVAAISVAVPSGSASAGQRNGERRPTGIVAAWASAWSGTDPQALARLFTADATYTDFAVNVVSTGQEGVASWKQRTDLLIADVHVVVKESFRSGDHVAIETVYSGHIHGAPTPFAVPTTTILELRHGLIAVDKDYYSLATVLAQSGLPADWTPPAA